MINPRSITVRSFRSIVSRRCFAAQQIRLHFLLNYWLHYCMLMKLIIRQNVRISIFKNLLSFLHFFDLFSDIFQFSLSIFWHYNKFLVHCLTFLYFDQVIFWHIKSNASQNDIKFCFSPLILPTVSLCYQNKSLLIDGFHSTILYLSETRQTLKPISWLKISVIEIDKEASVSLFSTI